MVWSMVIYSDYCHGWSIGDEATLTEFIMFCSYVWAAAGKQADLEQQVGVGGYGYPALVALNVKKGVYAPLRSAFELDQVM